MQVSSRANHRGCSQDEGVATRRGVVVWLAALAISFLVPRVSLAQNVAPLGLVLAVAEVSLDLETAVVDQGDPLEYTIGITNLTGSKNFVGLLLSLILPGGEALQLAGPLPLDLSFGKLTVTNGLPTGALVPGGYTLVAQLLADDGGAVVQVDIAAAGFTVQ